MVMLEAALEGIMGLFNLTTLGFMILGVVAGLMIAAIPGIGPVPMLGILVPFTFTMDPSHGFVLMLGFVTAGVISDSLPAILLGIPGSASSQATILDGYAMTKRGEAARAIGASLTASLLGGFFGAFVLSIAILIIRPFVLAFGVPEFLVLAIWGISLVGILSGNAPLKGVIVGGIGLLIGAIGADPNLGFARWTFGQSYFYDGISLELIGLSLFAIPEIISLAVRQGSISRVNISKDLFRGQLQGAKDVFKNPGVFLKTSGFGTLCGAIPGIGSSVVDWLAYGMTVQWSKDKSKFGKGDVRGVIGVDGANNAIYSGNMIPTLAFGIPGSLSMAFLLIMMYAYGIQPGADFLTKPENVSLVYFLCWGLALANVFGVLITFSATGLFVKLTTVSYYYLFSTLIPIIFIASYYTNNNIYDLFVLLFFSIIGYIFKLFHWPRAPMLIGLVLSQSVESYYGLSMNIFGWSWITRPIVLVLWVVIIVGLIISVRWTLSKQKKSLPQEDEQVESAGVMVKEYPSFFSRLKNGDTLFTLFLLAVLAAGLVNALSWPETAARFPLLIGSIVLLLLVILLVQRLRVKKELVEFPEDIPPELHHQPQEAYKRALISFLWVFGLLGAVLIFGMYITLPLFTLTYLKWVGRLRWLPALVLSAIIAILITGFGGIANIFWYEGFIFKTFF
jgi:TctA family transporter